jgi:hypothetical protein
MECGFRHHKSMVSRAKKMNFKVKLFKEGGNIAVGQPAHARPDRSVKHIWGTKHS